MKVKALLTSALVLGSVVFSAVGQVEKAAAAIFIDANGQFVAAPDPVDPNLEILRAWKAEEAVSDGVYHGGNHNHAIWLPELVGGGNGINKGTFVWDGPAFLYEFTNGTAYLEGTAYALLDEGKPLQEQRRFDASVWFETSTAGTGGPKRELRGSAYSNDNPVDTDEWWYYTINPDESTLIGVEGSRYDGWTLNLSEYTTRYNAQFGVGASGKNVQLNEDGSVNEDIIGLAAWFAYEGTRDSRGHADFNLDLHRLTPIETNPNEDPEQIPEPAMGLLAVGLVGFTLRSLKRKTT